MTPAERLTWAEPTRGYPPPRLTRWGTTWRYGLSVLWLLLALVALIVTSSETPVAPPWLIVLDVALFPVALVLIARRRRHPLGVAVALSCLVGISSSSGLVWAWSIISLATRRRWREVAATGGVTLLSTAIAMVLTELPPTVTVTTSGETMTVTDKAALVGVQFVAVALLYAALVAWGFYVGARRDLVASLTERVATAEREQALRVAQGRSDERARIAREMHDVLAHRISLVSMHAGILAYRDDLTGPETAEVARVIEANASASLTELRGVLGTLREPGAPPDKPQPTLADLPALLDDARVAGASIVVSDAVAAPETLPASIGRHAYRIVQEALTNARKHAVDAPVTVSLTGRPGDGLSIGVTNPLTASRGVEGSGLGLVGLAERAQIAGGWCTAGGTAGRFVVTAWLPWE